jgi:hypothetical protein
VLNWLSLQDVLFGRSLSSGGFLASTPDASGVLLLQKLLGTLSYPAARAIGTGACMKQIMCKT